MKPWFYGLHRDFSLTFALDFLDLTTFYNNDFWFIPQQSQFRQVHFRHLVLHMRLLCNMIINIHCDLCIRMFFAPLRSVLNGYMIVDIHYNLCIWMVFAPLRSVLNGCPPDIQHPITYCITLGLTLFSPSLVHPVWRSVCGCVKYRTKKILFFLPKTIWRFHQVVPAPLVSFDKSFLSCSSYLCSEKYRQNSIRFQFHPDYTLRLLRKLRCHIRYS